MPLKLYEKEEILDSCFKSFSEHGYSKTTTVMLSEAAGISKALLFHHFKNKKQLYISVLEHCFQKMSKDFVEESPMDFEDYFEVKGKSGLNKINYLRQHPDISKILFEAYVDTPNELKDEIFKFVVKMKAKYSEIEENKQRQLKKLFHQIQLNDDIDQEEAYELIQVVDDYFRKKIAKELTDSNKIQDDAYWHELIAKKKSFLNMIRHGIER